ATCVPSSTRTRTTRPPYSDPTFTVRASSDPLRTSSFGWFFSLIQRNVAVAAIASSTIGRSSLRRFGFAGTATSGNDCAARPDVDQLIDVGVERVRFGRYVEDLMQEDVRLQRAHEKECGSARVADANDARF